MSRSGYSDDGEYVALWRGQVASAIRGKRGQAFLREMAAALDALPEKRLIAEELGSLNITRRNYEVCALGSVGLRRGLKLDDLDPYDRDELAKVFGIAYQLICEIAFLNDEAVWRPTPEERWRAIRDWVSKQIKPEMKAER